MADECCANCAYLLKLTMYDYSHGGCQHWPMGVVCTAMDDEVIYMYGCDLECGKCECYKPKEE